MNNSIKILNNNGFFSCCTERLRNAIKYYNSYKVLPMIDSSYQWGGYKDENIDITNKFFINNDSYSFEIAEFEFTKSIQEDQFSDYGLINFDHVKHFILKYFSVSNEVYEIKNKLIDKYQLDLNKTLSVYYRGNDKINETNIPTYEEFLEIIKMRLDNSDFNTILIQSDEKEFFDFMSDKFENLVFFDEMIKSNKGDFNNMGKIPHGKKTFHAQLFLSIILIISESNSIIMNSCNTSMWISLFRGSVRNVSQYLNPKEYIYGVKNNNFDLIKEKWINN